MIVLDVMHLYDVLFFICKYHEWKCIMFYAIYVMLLNDESNVYECKWLNYMNGCGQLNW